VDYLYLLIQLSTFSFVSTISVSEARARLQEVLERVAAGDEVTLTRHGLPVAVVVRPDQLRSRRALKTLDIASDLADELAKGRRAQLRRQPTVSKARANTLVADVRSSRAK
jgi:prevent-host-death family protein